MKNILVITLIIFVFGCKDKNDQLNNAINDIRQSCIDSLSSDPNEKWRINNVEYDLGKEWHYEFEKEIVSVIFNRSFFFLIQKDVTFSNTLNAGIKKHIRTIYSCSGVPPHLITIERSCFSEDLNGKLNPDKKQVLEGGKLVDAPTKEDIFFDVLRHQEMYEKKR